MKNVKSLASQEVLHLFLVFAVSLKEAKKTFLTPVWMTLINCSSLIIYLGLKEAVCKILNS